MARLPAAAPPSKRSTIHHCQTAGQDSHAPRGVIHIQVTASVTYITWKNILAHV